MVCAFFSKTDGMFQGGSDLRLLRRHFQKVCWLLLAVVHCIDCMRFVSMGWIILRMELKSPRTTLSSG